MLHPDTSTTLKAGQLNLAKPGSDPDPGNNVDQIKTSPRRLASVAFLNNKQNFKDIPYEKLRLIADLLA